MLHLQYGIKTGAVKIIPCPDGDGIHEPVAQIGEHWFYFAGSEGEEETAEGYVDAVGIKAVAEMIENAMYSLEVTERVYHLTYLEEHGCFHYPHEEKVRIQELVNYEVVKSECSVVLCDNIDFQRFVERMLGNSVKYEFQRTDHGTVLANQIIPADEENCAILVTDDAMAVRAPTGWFVTIANAYGGEYPGFDTEFVPDEKDEKALSNFRVLFEEPAESEIPEIKIWDNKYSEDYTQKITNNQ